MYMYRCIPAYESIKNLLYLSLHQYPGDDHSITINVLETLNSDKSTTCIFQAGNAFWYLQLPILVGTKRKCSFKVNNTIRINSDIHFNIYSYLFWSAKQGGKSTIWRSSLSGTNQTLLVHSLLLVTDIVASDAERRIYWLDIGRETLETCDYEGLGRRVLKRSDSLLMLMSGLTLHKVHV